MSFWKSCLWTSSLLQTCLVAVCFPWFQLRNGFFDLLVHAPSCLDSSTWNPQTILLPAWEALAAEGAACNSLFLLPGCTKIFNIIKKKKVCISSPCYWPACFLLMCPAAEYGPGWCFASSCPSE